MCEKKIKVCSRCKEEKPITEFSKDKSTKDGHRSNCKVCRRKSQKKYYEDNREKERARSKKYIENNPEKRKGTQKKYRKNNREKIKDYQKKYREDNQEKVRLQRFKRRARLREAKIEDFSHKDLLDFWSENEIKPQECFYCKKEMPEGPEHIDHYIPLIKGGTHERENLRPSCASCNLSKHAKHPEIFMEELKNSL